MSYDCYCDYDPPRWISVRNVKAARKPHKCDECGAPIFAGERAVDALNLAQSRGLGLLLIPTHSIG